MPKLNSTGPDGKGSGTGRGLGNCKNKSDEEKLHKLGKGIGKKRNSSEGNASGKGKRLRSGLK